MRSIIASAFIFLLACSSAPQKADPAAKAEAQKVFKLALSHANAGRLIEAEAYFRKSIELDPDALDGYLGLGGLFVQLDRAQESVGIYQDAMSRVGEKPELLEDLATAYERLEKKELAIQSLQKALEIRSKLLDTPENRLWMEKDKEGIQALTKR